MPRQSRAHQRRLLISRVSRNGVVMAFKCLECQRLQVDCQRSTADSKSCLRCLRGKKTCVLEAYSELALRRLDEQREAIRLRKESAREAAVRLSQELAERQVALADALGRVSREEKTLELLDKKVEKMVRLGLENLDELEAEEAASEERARQSTPSVAGAGVRDFNFDAYLSADPLSPSAWVLPSSGTD